MKLRIPLEQLKDLEKNFDAFQKEAEIRIAQTSDMVARETEAEAKRLAPRDMGKLHQNITWSKPLEKVKSVFTRYIVSAMPYSAYVEFGTRGFVDIPEGWEEIAKPFKADPLIKQTNIHPQPFMYPAYVKSRKLYPKRLNETIKLLINKFNKK